MPKSQHHHFALTNRELDVLQLMTQALSNREISEELGVGVEAVRMHAKNIYAKLSVSGRHQASLKAIELGLLQSNSTPQTSPNTNLPPNPPQFIGRKQELLELSQIFERGDQLITLLGAGGMGKTRLALEYAYQHLADYANGVFFVHLESVSSVESIISQFVEALSIPVSSKSSYEQQVLDFLSDKQALLVVDNWEHLLDGSIILSEIIKFAPNVHIIATSREALPLRRAVIYRLQGLAIPNLNDLDNSYDYDAVQFLQKVAQQQVHNWKITEDNIVTVIKLCNLTQGTPLGILLAVSWISIYTLDQILEEIQKSITFLKSDLHDLPQRHRSIYDVFEWSWGLLTPKEQTTFMKLSVFRNGSTFEAVQKITHATPEVLQSLIGKSLVQRSGTERYQIHELMRQFGGLKLKQDAVVDAEIRECHAIYYAEIAEQMVSNRLIGQDALIELDNLYTAWYWVVDTRKFDILKHFVSTYGMISYQLNNHMEVRQLFNYALKSTDIYESDHLYLLGSLKFVSSAIGMYSLDWQQTFELLEDGEAIFADVDWTQLDLETIYAFYHCVLTYRTVDYKKSISLLTKIITTLEAHEKHESNVLATMLAYSYSQMCYIYYVFASELEKAKLYGIESLQMARKIRHKTLIALNSGFLGHIEFMLGNHKQATHYFQESMGVYQELNSTVDFGYILQYAGENALALAQYDDARSYLKHSLDLLNGYGPINGMLTLACVVSQWKYINEDYIGATELVAYSQHNDDSSQRVKDVIDRIWGEFSPPINPQEYQLAVDRGKTMDYDTIVRKLYIWLE